MPARSAPDRPAPAVRARRRRSKSKSAWRQSGIQQAITARAVLRTAYSALTVISIAIANRARSSARGVSAKVTRRPAMIASRRHKCKKRPMFTVEVGDHNQKRTELGDVAQSKWVAQHTERSQLIVSPYGLSNVASAAAEVSAASLAARAHPFALRQVLRAADRGEETHARAGRRRTLHANWPTTRASVRQAIAVHAGHSSRAPTSPSARRDRHRSARTGRNCICGTSAIAAATNTTIWISSDAPLSASRRAASSAITIATDANLASLIPTTPAASYTNASATPPQPVQLGQFRGTRRTGVRPGA